MTEEHSCSEEAAVIFAPRRLTSTKCDPVNKAMLCSASSLNGGCKNVCLLSWPPMAHTEVFSERLPNAVNIVVEKLRQYASHEPHLDRTHAIRADHLRKCCCQRRYLLVHEIGSHCGGGATVCPRSVPCLVRCRLRWHCLHRIELDVCFRSHQKNESSRPASRQGSWGEPTLQASRTRVQSAIGSG